jgi:hypothetical protein
MVDFLDRYFQVSTNWNWIIVEVLLFGILCVPIAHKWSHAEGILGKEDQTTLFRCWTQFCKTYGQRPLPRSLYNRNLPSSTNFITFNQFQILLLHTRNNNKCQISQYVAYLINVHIVFKYNPVCKVINANVMSVNGPSSNNTFYIFSGKLLVAMNTHCMWRQSYALMQNV